ncbi:unnamed protein product [Cylicocyclus nassatus]|uniref:MULE transposase domain-containing protein n=1 Tax=Cylicocyclus nassatus TaxID=53992 RepID=A0AA36HAD4_CYLNA|nr:unnamed protein product [Cylicocyclus nassatus]
MSFYDFYNVQMLQAMQQFYATSDLSSQQLLLGPQQLFTSNNTITPNELYLQNSDLYLESESNNEAVALQAPETSTPVVIHTSANEEIIPEAQPIYRGEKEMSKRGTNFVLLYDIPNSPLCYIFSHHRKIKQGGTIIYRCRGCQQQNDCYTSVQVQDDVFESDPCMLSHNCIPLDRYCDKANRHGYQACQTMRKDKKAYKTTPYRHFSETAHAILTDDTWRTLEEREKVLGKFHGRSYEQRRRTFAKAANAHKRTVDPSNIPEDLRNVPGGEVFLQLQTDDLHIYFSRKVVELARDHGLHALIGDGVHKLNPVTIPNRMDKGQLYVVHGAIQGGIEVPLLYAVTRFKTVGTYKIVFESLREVLGEYKERFVVDFEKAAIRAARETFPETDVQGCAFHLAQAWNRASVNLGLRKFIRGPKAVRGMWCKWGMQDYRTTNAAEAFHSKLRGMLSKRINPPFEELLECLHSINSLALGMLKHVQENARASRALRKKDQERRDKINNAMDEFKEMLRLDDDLEIDVINNYCRKMSQFVTEKTI